MGHQPELQIEQRKLLDLHLELVLKENERSNLTRIVDWQQGQLLHIEDSLVGLQEFEDAPSGRAADLGSGGGFPGIPLSNRIRTTDHAGRFSYEEDHCS